MCTRSNEVTKVLFKEQHTKYFLFTSACGATASQRRPIQCVVMARAVLWTMLVAVEAEVVVLALVEVVGGRGCWVGGGCEATTYID